MFRRSIYLLRCMMKRYQTYTKDLHLIFIDLKKAYDIVSRDILCRKKKGVRLLISSYQALTSVKMQDKVTDSLSHNSLKSLRINLKHITFYLSFRCTYETRLRVSPEMYTLK